MFTRSIPVTTGVCVALCLTFAGLSAVHATVEFNFNAGFEDGTQVPGLPRDYGPDHTAHPWSYWGNDNSNPAAPQAANPNPFPDANNPSPRVWANFNNPNYVNAASQNDSSLRPATGMWFVPGATYHFTGQWYVPSSEIVGGTTEARGAMILSMANSNPPGQPTYVKPLRRDYWEDPDTMLIPVVNPVSATIPTDQWVTKAFDWVFPELLPQLCKYPSIRLFGGNGQYVGGAKGAPNPGGYFDNYSITSDDYRDDLHGFVKDYAGDPVEGATVTLSSPFTDKVDVVTTADDGSYELPTWAPHGYEFSVDAVLDGVPSNGPQSLMVTATDSQFPDITMVPEPSTLSLLLAGMLGLFCRVWRRR